MPFIPDPIQPSSTKSSGFVPDAPPPKKRGFLEQAESVVGSIFPGRQVGRAIGTLGGLGVTAAKEALGFAPKGTTAAYDTSAPTPLQVAGDIASGAATVAGLRAPLPTSFLGSVGQFGALSGVVGTGDALARGESVPQALTAGATSAAIGAAAGGIFNLAGKAISAAARKAGPPTLSFTSGVPAEALREGARAPAIAQEGKKLSVEAIRGRAVDSLSTLYKDLGDEFASGLDDVVAKTGQTSKGVAYNQQGFLGSADKVRTRLTNFGREFAREFRLGTKMTPEGVAISFEKSPIVSPGEQRAVQEVFRTISTWDDFSAKGVQDLAERVGALRNFESGARTESSAIVGKIYHKIAGSKGIIPDFYPELATLRANYASSRKMLDEISNVLSANKTAPVSIQSSISRLSNLFKSDRETYVKVIQELSRRSGVDYVALLAGTEFQKWLPNFVRGIGGGAAIAVGGASLNPFLWLLAPLFSPRIAGKVAQSAPTIARLGQTVARFGTSQVAPRLFQK